MAQSADLTAFKAALATKRRKKTNVMYFPIGRTLSTLGGVLRMVNASDIKMAFQNLENGDLGGFASRIQSAMNTSMKQKAEGVGMISTGVVLGKALDATKTNPRVRIGKYGVKLV